MLKDRFKFRLYDKAIGEMVYDVCVGFIKDSGKTDDWVCANTSCGQITYRGDKLKDIVLMQCTGLKDKNGKLIYEGDIIKCSYDSEFAIGVIEWDSEELQFALKIEDAFYSIRQKTKFDIIEILGNIYENPELLENKQ